MKLIERTGAVEEQQVLCPICDFNCAHIATVSISPVEDGSTCRVHPEGVDIEPGSSGGMGRGSSVIIRFWGECGHVWDSDIYFHKGEVFVRTREIKDVDAWSLGELWRD